MNRHCIIVMVRWMITEKNPLFSELKKIPFNERKSDKRLLALLEEQKTKWSGASSIERLATLGWNTNEAAILFSQILDNLIPLQLEYLKEIKTKGKPKEWKDMNLTQYEKYVKNLQF